MKKMELEVKVLDIDKDKFIDIKFEKADINFNDLVVLFHNAFEDLYKHLIYTPQYYNRMLYIDVENATLFNDVVNNYIDIINSSFTLYNILLLVNNESEIHIRLNLV